MESPVAARQYYLSKPKYELFNETGQKIWSNPATFFDAAFSQQPISVKSNRLLEHRRPANFVTFERP